jgi:hypothetical protein
MEIKFSVFTDKVARYEKLSTIRLWTYRRPPEPGDFLRFLTVAPDPKMIACGYCTAVTPIIVTTSQMFYLDGRLLSHDEVKALALLDGFDSFATFWAFFHQELMEKGQDASSGWLIEWKRPAAG